MMQVFAMSAARAGGLEGPLVPRGLNSLCAEPPAHMSVHTTLSRVRRISKYLAPFRELKVQM